MNGKFWNGCKKRLLCCALSLTMLICFLPVSALGSEAEAISTPVETPSEPIPAPEALAARLTSNVRSAFVDGEAIELSLHITGGAPEYTVAWKVTLNGEVVSKTEPMTTTESTASFSCVPHAFGVHRIVASITDAEGQTVVCSISVPVAERDAGSLAAQILLAEQVELTGDWSRDMLAIAISQLGYMESKTDFIIDGNGALQSYSVYGAWCRLPYEEWCSMFVSFCAHYAGIPDELLPRFAACRKLLSRTEELGVFHLAGGYEPQPGDIIFFNLDEKDDPDHVGIVEFAQDGEVFTVEGNSIGGVARASYSCDDSQIMGYANLSELMKLASIATEKAPTA